MPDTSQMLTTLAQGLSTPVRAPILHTPDEYGMAYEDITFPSLDGTPLEAWWIPRAGSNKLVIANHPMPMNRYGFPSHLPRWQFVPGNDIEVNYMREYQHLHEAGYNVLTYDARNHGQSGVANGNIFTWGLFESRDVAGSLKYVKSRPDTRGMKLALLSRCMGANATFVAKTRYPELFADVQALVAVQPISMRAMVERNLEYMGLADQFDAIDREVQLITSFRIDQVSPLEYAKHWQAPAFLLQVRDDALTKPGDVQSIFDNIPVADKKLFWLEGSTRRWDGYNYFSEHPEQLIAWFDEHVK
ncbi:alpha/beta hydrolase family protein [Burkholderia seminalis]|uniref:alpha/beta hydrolase family protein n=1 Tax=Burkholderia seminalis TaxID=488731 RepID=UPI0026563704|nr:alpha/beta hydrolase [Burkholderia seminalis]MDN7589926.1 alpha/beta hydrolase [Burkholderia seminalis]